MTVEESLRVLRELLPSILSQQGRLVKENSCWRLYSHREKRNVLLTYVNHHEDSVVVWSKDRTELVLLPLADPAINRRLSDLVAEALR